MRARLIVAVVFGLAIAGSISYAQSSGFQAAVRDAVAGSTLDEVIRWSDAQFARTSTVGRYVRWGGAIVIGASLIYAAMDYFYRELQRQTGTSLDYYRRANSDPLPPSAWLAAVNMVV